MACDAFKRSQPLGLFDVAPREIGESGRRSGGRAPVRFRTSNAHNDRYLLPRQSPWHPSEPWIVKVQPVENLVVIVARRGFPIPRELPRVGAFE